NDGKPVLHADLLKDIHRALAGRRAQLERGQGHSRHAPHEAARRRPHAAPTAFAKDQDPDIGPGYRGRDSGDASAARVAAPAPPPESAADLFSLFDRPPEEPPAGCSTAIEETALVADAPGATDFEQITAREQALLGDRLRADAPSAAELLHPSFSEVGASGR